MLINIEALRNKIKVNNYDKTKLCNYTGISIGKMMDFIKGENSLNELELKMLSMRVTQYHSLK